MKDFKELKIDKWVEETISSIKALNKRKLGELLDVLKSGDYNQDEKLMLNMLHYTFWQKSPLSMGYPDESGVIDFINSEPLMKKPERFLFTSNITNMTKKVILF